MCELLPHKGGPRLPRCVCMRKGWKNQISHAFIFSSSKPRHTIALPTSPRLLKPHSLTTLRAPALTGRGGVGGTHGDGAQTNNDTAVDGTSRCCDRSTHGRPFLSPVLGRLLATLYFSADVTLGDFSRTTPWERKRPTHVLSI